MQGEEGGREVRGRGRAGEAEAETEPHQLHSGAAQRAGAALRRDALPGRVHAGGAEPAAGSVGGQGPGTHTGPGPGPEPLFSCVCVCVEVLLCSTCVVGVHVNDLISPKFIQQTSEQTKSSM